MRLLTLLPLLLAAETALGATLQRVHKDRDKILLQLSQAELTALDVGQEVVIEVNKPRFVTSGKVTRINAAKKTAVIEFDAVDNRFQAKQQIRILSPFWNVELSPLMTSYAQYHQYTRSDVEAGLGTFFEGTQEKAGASKGKTTASGTRFAASGYTILSPSWFGVGLSYERRDAIASDTTVPAPAPHTSVTIADNIIRPGGWFEIEPHWRVGLRYLVTLLDYDFHSGGGTYSYSFGQPELTVLQYDANGEIGLTYTAKDKFNATSTVVEGNGAIVNSSSAMKMPAELNLAYRHVSSPVFIWGLGAGYIFWERNQDPNLPLEPKAFPEQMTRLHLSFEDRLDDGDKLEWLIAYDGGKALGYTTMPQRANMGSLSLTYQTTAFDTFVFGGTGQLAGGEAQESEDQLDPKTGQPINVTRTIMAYRASLMLFAHYEFDLFKKGRRH